MDELPTDASCVGLIAAIPGRPAADAVDPAWLLDVDINQFAGCARSGRAHRLKCIECAITGQARLAQDTAD